MHSGLASKVVLVTGAGAGIGKATAAAFAREGARVVFTDRTDSAGSAVEHALRAKGLEASFRQSDATSSESVRALVQDILGTYGRLDVAVNNVGGVHPAEMMTHYLHEVSPEGWAATMELSLTSTFLCMKYELEAMMSQGGGVICNTASLAGMRVSPNSSPAYGAAKAGVIHLSRKAAVTYAPHNIRINVVAPGMTAVEWLRKSRPESELYAAVRDVQPMQRWMEPDEVAQAFVWICSDSASGITGHTIPVDGGWAAR